MSRNENLHGGRSDRALSISPGTARGHAVADLALDVLHVLAVKRGKLGDWTEGPVVKQHMLASHDAHGKGVAGAGAL